MKYLILIFFSTTIFSQTKIKNTASVVKNSDIMYAMPEESAPHEGTWLQWPHEYQYEAEYSSQLNETWVAMTKALATSEIVHIIVYNNEEKEKVEEMLEIANVNLDKIDFNIFETDDVWIRDNGTIFVKDKTGKTIIEDWGFNGWGKKAKYANCNAIPSKIANSKNIEIINLNNIMINEGGAVEIDGNGTLLATKSAMLNANRNPGMTQIQAENIFRKYYGITNFIWLNGLAGQEITDMHIDGFARFANASTIITMVENDLIDWQVPENDIDILYSAKNKNKKPYNFIKLPLTQNNVTTDYGKRLDYKGSYINYYIANKVVLVPNYIDKNDTVANAIIQKLYPTRKVVGIDVRNLYANGGMIHCVTQQQPK